MNGQMAFYFVVTAACAAGGARIAQIKNRSPWFGAGLGALLGIFGVLILLFLRKRPT